MVSLSWCIRQGTRGEGDGDADYLPPPLLERCYSIVAEEDDRKKEESVAKALSKCGYPAWTINRVKQDIMEKSLKDEAKKTKGKRKGMVVVPCERTETFVRILNLAASLQVTILTERYGTLWFI